MKKLIVIMAVTGLLAVGCSSRRNQGGVNENNPSYGTGTTESGTTENNPGKGAENLTNGNSVNTNAPSSGGPADNGTGIAPGSPGDTGSQVPR